MYNPTEGKLQRNKYLNIGYSDSLTWKTRKLIADCIQIYLDEFTAEPEFRTTENALVMIPLFKCFLDDSEADRIFEKKLNENCSKTSARIICQMLKEDNEKKNRAAEILYLINSGPFMLNED